MQQGLDQHLLETSPKAPFTSPLFSLGKLFCLARVDQVMMTRFKCEIESPKLLFDMKIAVQISQLHARNLEATKFGISWCKQPQQNLQICQDTCLCFCDFLAPHLR